MLALLWALLLVLAGTRPLAVPDEGRYGEIGRWMLQSGDWLTPRLNGLPFFHKPPYLYWFEALALASFGVNELALRLVPALHAGLMLLSLYWAARRIGDEYLARRACLMLGTSLSFLMGGQYLNHDMLVASWIAVAIWCFAFSFQAGAKPQPAMARLGFVACALGVLSKGLIGLALPGLVLLLWLLWNRQLKKMLYLPWLSGLLLFGLIALPWFVLVQQQHPDALGYLFGNHQLQRYTATTFNNARPWWFYLLALALMLFPWVFFALRALGGPKSQALGEQPLMAKEWHSLCWIWLGVILVFFSIPNSKLLGYILPAVPPLTLLSALGWHHSMGQRAAAGKIFTGLCLLTLGLAVTFNFSVAQLTRDKRSQDVAAVLACAAQATDNLYVAGRYPYDLPFYLQLAKPLIVIQDWDQARQKAGDGWQREMFEAANFDTVAGQVLKMPDALAQAAIQTGNWLLTPKAEERVATGSAWTLFYQGAGWTLFRSGLPLAAESPVTTEHKGLPGCKNQR